MTTETAPDSAPTPSTADPELTRRVDTLDREHRDTRAMLIVFLAVAFGSLFIYGVWSALGPKTSPTTRDDSVEQLLSAGPHCYGSGEEMAAARQRALAAIDRMEWAWEWRRDHPGASDGGPLLPLSVPSIVGPTDPGVPPSSDPNQGIDTDICFGVTGD